MKYAVKLHWSTTVEVEVEATSQEEAIAQAREQVTGDQVMSALQEIGDPYVVPEYEKDSADEDAGCGELG